MDYSKIFSLKDKVIVVTGGTGILGKAFVDGIISHGGIAIIVGRNETEGKKRVDEILANGGEAMFVQTDVLNEKQVENLRDTIIEKYSRIDGLVNGAGGNMPQGVIQHEEDVFNMSIEGMKQVLDLNLWGTIIPTKVLGAVMAKGKGGSIVNISSVSSKQVITKVIALEKLALNALQNGWP
jgi:NAD(P)-dependent dehydrogenase (short-subunit alcohol dehydrogenase family)